MNDLIWDYHSAVRAFDRDPTAQNKARMEELEQKVAQMRRELIAKADADLREQIAREPPKPPKPQKIPYWKTEKGKAAYARYIAKKKAKEAKK